MKKIGSRGSYRKEVNKELFEFFNNLSITSCEAKLTGCTGKMYLTFAHSKKSRKFIEKEDWLEAILACQICHSYIEAWKPELMEAFVKNVIKNRNKI